MNPNNMKRKVLLTEGGLEQLQAERQNKIQFHLNELSQQLATTNNSRDLVLREAIAREGVPTADVAQDELIDRCNRLADKYSRQQLREKFSSMAVVLKELNVRDFPDPILWAARNVGVELVEPETEVAEDGGAH